MSSESKMLRSFVEQHNQRKKTESSGKTNLSGEKENFKMFDEIFKILVYNLFVNRNS